jgi:hypothetical protein
MRHRLVALALGALFLATSASAQTESTTVTTPAGATHGSLVSGNVPCATSHNQVSDCSPSLPGSSVSTATNTQTLQNKSISGAQNTLSAIPVGAMAAANATQGDANISISSSTRTVVIGTAFTAARTATLPAANSLPAGQAIRIVDYGGNLSAGGSDAILPGGSDTENGATASGCTGSILCQVMAAPGTVAIATTDGVSNWNVSLTLAQAEPVPPVADSVISIPGLIGQTSGTACIVGDSTSTVGPSQTNGSDPSQMVWGFLSEKLKHDLPGITWSFQNFGIGATNENNFNFTGTQLGGSGNPNIPSWFTNYNNTWASYVQAANCDVLFWMFGTNAANSGNPNGNGAATFIRQGFETIQGWSKVPKLVIVTNKTANPATDTSGDDANEAFHKTQAAFHRTFARSDANGYTSFSGITSQGLGLVDLGRYFTARIDGHDTAAQYFQTKPSCLANGVAIGAIVSEVNVQTSTICYTTHGDYRLTFVLPASGGTTLYGFGGSNAIKISAGILAGDYIRLNIASNGSIVPKYVLDGNIAGAPTIVGSTVPTTNGQDVTVTVALSQERVQLTICSGTTCTLALDADAPRFIGEQAGGTPINVGFASAPSGSPTMDITEFWEGIGYPTQAFSSYNWAMGPPGTCEGTPTTPNCQGGNANNHQRSNSAALDRQIINALQFAVPAAASSSQFGQVEVDGTTIKSTAGVISAPTSGQSQFSNTQQGVVPPSGGGTTNYQRADGAWAPPPGTTCGGSACGTFATQNFATPPAIGNTTPAPGTFTTLTNTGHVISNGTALTSGNVAFGTGAGTGPTLNSINGDDHKFSLTFTTGTSPTLGGVAWTVTFANAYGSAPICMLSAGGGTSANVISHGFVSATTTTVSLTNQNAAYGAAAALAYSVLCTG